MKCVEVCKEKHSAFENDGKREHTNNGFHVGELHGGLTLPEQKDLPPERGPKEKGFTFNWIFLNQFIAIK